MTQKPENINYNAYVDDGEDIAPPKANEKLAKRSRFNRGEEKKTPQDLDKKILAHQKKDLDVKNQVIELTNMFMGVVKDTTLDANKNPAKKDQESEIIKSLCALCLQMNNDQNQPEGIGSIGLNNLLLRTILIQRDAINNLSYQVHQLKKGIADVIEALNEDENG